MKRFLLTLIICTAFSVSYAEPSYSASVSNFKLRIENNRSEKNTIKQIKALFDLQTKYTNVYDIKGLASLYADNYVDNDGYTKKVYFKLIQDTWDTYPDITYKTDIKNIKVNGDYAIVETFETAVATDDEDSELIAGHGELYSTATCVYYLKRINDSWLISAEHVVEEQSTLKYGDARFVKMELNAPSLIGAGEEYTAELKVDLPKDQIVIASINKERIVQLLDSVPEYKMGYILAYVQGITADEESDEDFCEELWQDYKKDKDPDKDKEYTLEECKKEWGID